LVQFGKVVKHAPSGILEFSESAQASAPSLREFLKDLKNIKWPRVQVRGCFAQNFFE
jgi:hypothetical protein